MGEEGEERREKRRDQGGVKEREGGKEETFNGT